MQFIDTHTHIFLSDFNDDRDTIIKNAQTEGVVKMLLPNVDSSTIKQLSDTVEKYPNYCFPAVGLHPTSVNKDYSSELQIVEQYLNSNKVYAIGEIGIDLYWDKTYLKEQETVFRHQINLAKAHNLPIIIHARDSFNEIFNILDDINDNKLTGVFHAFTGNKEQANKIIDLGFKIGLGGILTFKNSGLDKVVSDIDIKNIVLETDSPYLAPTPKRGKRNESAYIKYIANKLAEIKEISIKEVAEITTNNAEQLFKLS
ncbi:MAG: TatD family hydrolase [Bacteroidales bacterium]|nr:TatD family hydrolase [Bacteroidales bacterium]